MFNINSICPTSYIYSITCPQLGLVYDGVRKEQDFYSDDIYQGSSALLDKLAEEFNELDWNKTLTGTYHTFEYAESIETAIILRRRAEAPNTQINRSANNNKDVWEFAGVVPIEYERRLHKVLSQVRPSRVSNGTFRNLVLTKVGTTAHSPGMPSSDATPKPQYGNWSADLLRTFYSLPDGSYHFVCKVEVTAKGKKNYRPIIYLESFTNEDQARHFSTLLSKATQEEYEEYINHILEAYL